MPTTCERFGINGPKPIILFNLLKVSLLFSTPDCKAIAKPFNSPQCLRYLDIALSISEPDESAFSTAIKSL